MAGAAPKKVSYKLVLLGDTGVGKSSIVERYVKNLFFALHPPTIGVAYLRKTLEIDGYTIELDIWDTAGQERYANLLPMYYRGADAALVVYDITDEETFKKANYWINKLEEHSGNSDIVIGLAANKCDLGAAKRTVETAPAQAFADKKGCIFMETSAKTAANINEIFLAILAKLPRNKASQESGLILQNVPEKKSRGCCGGNSKS